MSKKETIVCYCQPPLSKGVQFIHNEMMSIVEVLRQKFQVAVVSRDRNVYEWHIKEHSRHFSDVVFVEYPKDNFDTEDQVYEYGMLSNEIKKLGKIDRVLVFSAGMKIVTPEDILKEKYDEIARGEHNTVCRKPEPFAICSEAEFLWTVIQDSPKFYNRVVDYTEADIGKVTGYPMKKFFYYVNDSLKEEGFHKLHDSELFFCLDYEKFRGVEKTLDFMYGWTVEIPERAYLSDFCFTHIKQTDKVKLFCKDKYYSKYAPITTQLDSDEYYATVAQAKFSLIAPSTTTQNTPLFRIYEDIARSCIPLFMKTVNFRQCFNDDLYEFAKDNLVYDEDIEPDFNKFLSTLDYDKLLRGLYSLPSICKYLDKRWVMGKILEELE